MKRPVSQRFYDFLISERHDSNQTIFTRAHPGQEHHTRAYCGMNQEDVFNLTRLNPLTVELHLRISATDEVDASVVIISHEIACPIDPTNSA